MTPKNFVSGHVSWKKWNLRFALTLALVTFSSCSSITVSIDHDPGTNFARYGNLCFRSAFAERAGFLLQNSLVRVSGPKSNLRLIRD